jgi:hypothetical protein
VHETLVAAVSAPDPQRLGGLAWARRTRGRLTGPERRRLLGAIAAGQVTNLAGRLKLALGRVPPGAAGVDVSGFTPPDSALAREAEAACREQSALIAGHSYRTWMFGLALATLDGHQLDRELFYCAALVHDYGADAPVAGEDFTLRSAERALGCARAVDLDEARALLIADAICCHATPGATVARDGAIACYVQAGAMVDGAGLRAWDLPQASREEVMRRHPRGTGFKREFADVVRAEARAVPDGRFGLLARCGLPLAVRLAPFAD